MELFHRFKQDISAIELPKKFTFPFYYEPHELSKIASNELQSYLETQTHFDHNFGLEANQVGIVIGKMFGVLVCVNKDDELGYLWAYSGKLANSNSHQCFVPTVYDMLREDGFYLKGEQEVTGLNIEIDRLENSEQLLELKENLSVLELQFKDDIANQKDKIKKLKIERDQKRIDISNFPIELRHEVENELSEESKKESILLKKMNKYWQYKLKEAKNLLDHQLNQLNQLKEIRKQKSSSLQNKLFKEYAFLNQNSELKSLGEIFDNNPPAGAGECCAPKLLHYAFLHNLKPIAMAEFWWGQSPKSEVRIHKQFYPSCKSKCEPILMTHMLKGLDLEDNPFLNTYEDKNIEIIYDDEDLAIINKPHEFLSVPGKQIQDCVYSRVKKIYPLATGPLIVHRLDMSTSGLMIIAKNETAYKKIQYQFISRTVKKRYLALLDGEIQSKKGEIDLPLRVDLEDRPRQLVCYDYGKQAITEYEVIKISEGKTLIFFYPKTGRTHQLRVHASHLSGLGTPIVGDDLYGKKSDRLHLQAQYIRFLHPAMNKVMEFELPFDFTL